MTATPKCIRCNKSPREIEEYVEAAALESTTPTLYVIDEEGTYNPINSHFYCTACYTDLGMPLGVAP